MKILLLAGASATGLAIETSAQSIDYDGLSSLYGQPVTTSANGSPQTQSDVPLNMVIITKEDIEKSGARNIPEVLRFFPGMSVEQKAFGQTEVSIRGYNQNNAERILVLLNGRQVYTDFFGQVVWDNIPVEINEIKQIEIVKGPNTALFGFNAVSGVINIITVHPLYENNREIDVRAGNHGFSEVSASISQKVTDGFAFRASGGAYHANQPYETVNRAVRDDVTRSSFALDLWGQITNSVQVQLEITNNEHDRNEFLIPGASPTHTQYDTSSIRARTIADTSWGLLEAEVYHNETQADFNIFLGSTAGATSIEADNRITVAKVADTFNVGNDHIFRVSGEYRQASNIFAETDGEDLQYEIWSVSGLWDWGINSKLRTSVAVRYDDFELDTDGGSNIAPAFPANSTPFTVDDFSQRRQEFSYNFGAVYKATQKDTIRASASRGADLPSFTEFGLQFLSQPNVNNTSGLATLGNPNTDTSIVYNYEIGYDREVDSIDGMFRTAIFYQYNEEMQAFDSAFSTTANFFGGGLNLDRAFLGNIGDSEMYGAEIALEGKYDKNWDWFLNYTFIEIDDDLRNRQRAVNFSSPQGYEDRNRQHIFNAHLGYTRDKWRANLFGQYIPGADGVLSVSNSNNNFSVEDINDQFIVNANIAYDVTENITFSVSGTSIAGQTQQSVESDAETALWAALKFKF